MEVKIHNYTLQHTQNDLFALYNWEGKHWVFLCVALTFKDKKVKDEEGSQIPCFPNILHMLMFLTTYCMTTYTQR